MNKHETADIKNRTLKSAKVADEAVHKYPYKAISLAASVGALLGFVLARHRHQKHA